MNGFDLRGALVPVGEIVGGGPPRDGIPALSSSRFEPARAADWLGEDDRILALQANGVAKAYPIRILNWHELVNDEVGGQPVLISFCPLCGTGMAFDPLVRGRRLTFGVSGLLYNSDLLMYDRETESLWTQIGRRAVTGPLRGSQARQIPLLHTTWGSWRKEHPRGLVLSRETGHSRDYDIDPYGGYARDQRLMFPVSSTDDRLKLKAVVLGITSDTAAKAYPFDALARVPSPIRDRVGEQELLVYFDRDSRTAFATNLAGESIPSTVAYWFAWSAFHPRTVLWESEVSSGR
ncbi:MAG: DUF3179 domain-containing protein [Gemmatimonadetes bacterium]|nr:DUF3179 domain-containing protein [Gemmatimonadota bacterium]